MSIDAVHIEGAAHAMPEVRAETMPVIPPPGRQAASNVPRPVERPVPKIVARLFPRSQRHGRAVAILTQSRRRRTMRAYITATGIAFGLLAIWAALVPLVA